MRLIDADALIERAKRHAEGTSFVYKAGVDTVCMFADEAPTVDAEPVTRCKDCRWYDTGHNEVDAWQRCRILKIETHDDFFCANGERADVQRV